MSLGCPNRALHEMPLTTHRPWLVSICGTKFHTIVKNIIHHFPMKSAMCPIESYHFPHSNDHGFLGVNWVNSHKFPLFLGVNWVNSHKFPVFLGVNWVNSHKFPLFLGVFLPFFWDKKTGSEFHSERAAEHHGLPIPRNGFDQGANPELGKSPFKMDVLIGKTAGKMQGKSTRNGGFIMKKPSMNECWKLGRISISWWILHGYAWLPDGISPANIFKHLDGDSWVWLPEVGLLRWSGVNWQPATQHTRPVWSNTSYGCGSKWKT